MALFGEGSFIEGHQAHPSAYSSSIKYDGSGIGEGLPEYADSCIGLAPLAPLLTGEGGEDILQSSISFCITNLIGSPNGETSIFQAMTDWVSIFNTDEERLTNAFNAAAFVANRAWIGNSGNSITRSLNVNYDLGADTQVPSISKAGLIFTSLLLGLYILVLVPLATYASGTARWTTQLDSFAMMRIGAAISDKLPLTVGKNINTMRGLDNISGWVGDSSEEKDPVGRLGLGAARPLNSRKDRRFECDEADKEEITEEEVIWARRNPGSSNI